MPPAPARVHRFPPDPASDFPTAFNPASGNSPRKPCTHPISSVADARPTAGFQLTELVVALAIMAILLAMAIPPFQYLLTRHRLADISNQTLWIFRQARADAVTHNQRVTVCRSADVTLSLPTCSGAGASWTSGLIVFIDDGLTSPPRPATPTDILRARAGLPDGYSLTRNGLTTSWISFAPNGRLKSGTLGVSFRIAPPSGSSAAPRQLCIATTGRIRLVNAAQCDSA